MVHERGECLSENALLAWAAGRISPVELRAIDLHLDACAVCQALVGEALRTSDRTRGARSNDRTFRTGDLVAQRYEVVRFIASGGMGEVYEVHDSWLNDIIALKTLVPHIADDPAALARLKAEVLLARRVSHSNVCRVFDLGFHERIGRSSGASERIAFLTMELLRGETLRNRLAMTKRLTIETLEPIALQLIAGIAHAHSAGIIHRDFKSDNVMLVPEQDGSPSRSVITDFGLARSALMQVSEPLTSLSRGVVGTLDYMAPEQIQGHGASRQADIYALGIVLFESITGRLPFEADSALARALARVQSEAPRPSTVVPGLEPHWDDGISRAIARDPGQRFQHVEELLEFLRPDIIASGRPHRLSKAPRWRWRQPTKVFAWASATGALAVIGSVAVTTFFGPTRANIYSTFDRPSATPSASFGRTAPSAKASLETTAPPPVQTSGAAVPDLRTVVRRSRPQVRVNAPPVAKEQRVVREELSREATVFDPLADPH